MPASDRPAKYANVIIIGIIPIDAEFRIAVLTAGKEGFEHFYWPDSS
jgi:hypothetical protein